MIGGGCLLELWMGGPVFLDCLLLSGHFIVHWICSAPAAEEDATLFTFLTFIGVEVRTCLPSTLLCSLFILHPFILLSMLRGWIVHYHPSQVVPARLGVTRNLYA